MAPPKSHQKKGPPPPPESAPAFRLGVLYEERKADPPQGLTWRKVTDGESLGTIAVEYGVRLQDLALHNFSTIRPDEINWYLHNFVGCKKHDGQWYLFSRADDPGQILVPDRPAVVPKKPGKVVKAVRNSTATVDTRLHVNVQERLADGSVVDVEGKWIYVFSAAGLDFVAVPPPTLIGDETSGTLHAPGSAFTRDMPGTFPITAKPDRLDYEIFVSSQDGPSQELVKLAIGEEIHELPRYAFGKKWHFVSDRKVLDKATSAGRETRDNHALRGDAQTVPLDLEPLKGGRRYYFLLSPVQLGPEGIKAAMELPAGLTPLLRPDLPLTVFNAGGATVKHVGPSAADAPDVPLALLVTDPYAWVEKMASGVLVDHVKHYSDWLNEEKTRTLEELKDGAPARNGSPAKAPTGWDPDRYFIARLLDSVARSPGYDGNIEGQIRDPAAWRASLERWDKELVQRNAELSAAAHKALIAIIDWLSGPAHRIIDIALHKDTGAGNAQDALDLGHGILHWAVCTELFIALEPGVLFLQDMFSNRQKGTFLHDTLLQYFEAIDRGVPEVSLSEVKKAALRYAYPGVLMLLQAKHFTDPPPPSPGPVTRQAYGQYLVAYQSARRDRIARFLNANKILPYQVGAPRKVPTQPDEGKWALGSTLVNSFLDATDKWSTYVISPTINIPTGKNLLLDLLAREEKWFQRHPTLSRYVNDGSGYALKGVALGISTYNLYSTIMTARNDYQRSVSALDWAGTTAGFVLAVQDVLAAVATLTKSAGLMAIFPELTIVPAASGGGHAWLAAQVSGAGAWFAGVNVVAMIVSGGVTTYNMGTAALQAFDVGDYTAGAFYVVATVGGIAQVAGGMLLGYSLMKAGVATSATGIGATAGVVLFVVGGIVAGISGLVAKWLSSDDYEYFAASCFLGKGGGREPVFVLEPRAWTQALSADSRSGDKGGRGPSYGWTWPLERQKRAIVNLLGRFVVETRPKGAMVGEEAYQGDIEFTITPGLLVPGTTLDVALHAGGDGPRSVARFIPSVQEPVLLSPLSGRIFRSARAFYAAEEERIAEIKVLAEGARHVDFGERLMATVTLRFAGYPNVITCLKKVLSFHPEMGFTGWKIVASADDDKAMSEGFEEPAARAK